MWSVYFCQISLLVLYLLVFTFTDAVNTTATYSVFLTVLLGCSSRHVDGVYYEFNLIFFLFCSSVIVCKMICSVASRPVLVCDWLHAAKPQS